jgi:D-sedoheptulose 7-phosphate isomerase
MVAGLITECCRKKGRILVCGNGGSAADAQHIAAEFTGRFYIERKPLDAEAITTNSSALTAIGNDYTYDIVFSRMIEAKGRKGDILIALSTSGKSRNIIEALRVGKEIGMTTVALVGEKSNDMLIKYADIIINIPCSITPRIQEAHIFVGHVICEMVEVNLFGK